MNREKKKHHFEKNETGYHKYAVEELAEWVQGEIEQPFYIEDQIAFVPDVVCYKNGVVESIYEIFYTHPVDGRKLGLIMDWCYRNASEITVFEVSAHYILKQTEKPGQIKILECYVINPFEDTKPELVNTPY